MDLSHEEKLIAMRGFREGIRKEAAVGAAAKGLLGQTNSVVKSLVQGFKGTPNLTRSPAYGVVNKSPLKSTVSGIKSQSNFAKRNIQAHNVGAHIGKNRYAYGAGGALLGGGIATNEVLED